MPAPDLPKESSPSKQIPWSKIGLAARAMLPSPLAILCTDKPEPPDQLRTELRHLDGLRGVAATIVFIEHFTLPFYLHGMMGDESRTRGVWTVGQQPVIRAIYNGGFAVALFFVMSGMVLSLRPLRMSADPAASLQVISSAAFRRGLRLLGPAVVLVLLTAVTAHFGIFERVYPNRPTPYYNLTTPSHLPTIFAQLWDAVLFIAIELLYPALWLQKLRDITTQKYGTHLWTISVEFAASQALFIALVVTVSLRRTGRTICLVTLASYTMWCGLWEIALFLVGALMAEAYASRDTHVGPPTTATRRFAGHVFGAVLILAGLWTGSIPDYNIDATPGFRTLWSLAPSIPLWRGLGAVLVIWAVTWYEGFQSPFHLAPIQYMGRISFSFYLLHLSLVTAIGWPLGHDWRDHVDQNSRFMPHVVVAAAGFLTFFITIWVADLFWRFVDLPCVRGAKNLERMLAV